MSTGPGGRALQAGFSIVLVCLIATQTAQPAAGAQAEGAPGLQIVILDGEGAINNIRQRTAREPIVQVEDENHKPVAGATILFLLPDSGPGGTFANGTRAFHTVTDADGRARAQMKPNSTAGNWDIIVQASFAGATASATIHQQNFSSAGSGSS